MRLHFLQDKIRTIDTLKASRGFATVGLCRLAYVLTRAVATHIWSGARFTQFPGTTIIV